MSISPELAHAMTSIETLAAERCRLVALGDTLAQLSSSAREALQAAAMAADRAAAELQSTGDDPYGLDGQVTTLRQSAAELADNLRDVDAARELLPERLAEIDRDLVQARDEGRPHFEAARQASIGPQLDEVRKAVKSAVAALIVLQTLGAGWEAVAKQLGYSPA